MVQIPLFLPSFPIYLQLIDGLTFSVLCLACSRTALSNSAIQVIKKDTQLLTVLRIWRHFQNLKTRPAGLWGSRIPRTSQDLALVSIDTLLRRVAILQPAWPSIFQRSRPRIVCCRWCVGRISYVHGFATSPPFAK